MNQRRARYNSECLKCQVVCISRLLGVICLALSAFGLTGKLGSKVLRDDTLTNVNSLIQPIAAINRGMIAPRHTFHQFMFWKG